jgi:hypothetical protein
MEESWSGGFECLWKRVAQHPLPDYPETDEFRNFAEKCARRCDYLEDLVGAANDATRHLMGLYDSSKETVPPDNMLVRR